MGLYGIDIGLPISLHLDINFIQGNSREKETTTMVTLGIYRWDYVVFAEDPRSGRHMGCNGQGRLRISAAFVDLRGFHCLHRGYWMPRLLVSDLQATGKDS